METAAPLLLLIEGEDPELIAERSLDLSRELSEAEGVDEVGPSTAGGPAAQGTKGAAEAVTIGALALAVLPATLPALIDMLKGWVQRDRRVTLKLKLGEDAAEVAYDPTSMTPEEIEDLIERLKRQLRSSESS